MRMQISVAEARRLVLNAIPKGPTEQVPLAQARTRTLAHPLVSRASIPPFDNAAMDGFAVRSADLTAPPTELRLIDDIPAGVSPQQKVESGTCARIMTGAFFPDGADAVVPVEWTEQVDTSDRHIRFMRTVQPGANVRRAGENLQPGQQVVGAGTVIDAAVIDILATLGYGSVPVRQPPCAAVLATGDELVDASDSPAPGQIRNSNGPALAARVESAGGTVLGPMLARDDRSEIRARLDEARQANVLVVAGGVSVGEHDLVRQTLDAMGAEWHFWKVRQRPGKPFAFGCLDDRPVFGLPGNPVAAAVCFEVYVRPALAAMLGRQPVTRPLVPATLAAPVRKKPGPYYFTRGVAEHDDQGCLHVRPTPAQNSHISSSLIAANCLIHLPEKMAPPERGARVQIEWLR